MGAERRRGTIVLVVLVGLISSSARSVVLILLAWVKFTTGQGMGSISSTDTLCVVSSF